MTPVAAGFDDLVVELLAAREEVPMSSDKRCVSRADDAVTSPGVPLDLKLVGVFLLAVVLDCDLPFRNRNVDTGHQIVATITHFELRDGVMTTMFAKDLEEQCLHLALRRAAPGIPTVERSADDSRSDRKSVV
jgi:hypothetical protein